jgi:hypothetical protein
MKQTLFFLLFILPMVFNSSCLSKSGDVDEPQNDIYGDEEYEHEDDFYIIGEDLTAVDDPETLSDILNQCNDDIYLINEDWSLLLLRKIFEGDYPADYIEAEEMEYCEADFLYKNEEWIVLNFDILYDEYFPEVAGVIAVFDLENGDFISAQIFERFVELERQEFEKTGYVLEYYVSPYAEDAQNKFGDTLVFFETGLEEERYEYANGDFESLPTRTIEITTQKFHALTKDGKFHEIEYVYRDL